MIAGTTKRWIGIHQFTVDSRQRTWYGAELTVGGGGGGTITVEYLPDESADVPRVARSSIDATYANERFGRETYF